MEQESGYASEPDSYDKDSFVYKIWNIQSNLNRYESELGVRDDEYFAEFDSRFRVFNDRLDESLKLKELFTKIERERIENDILQWANTCYDMMKTKDSNFYNIQENWRKMNERLKQTTSIESILTGNGMKKRRICVSSVYYFLEAESTKHLDYFWQKYSEGKLEEEIRQLLFEGEAGENDGARLTLKISEKNYTSYRANLGKMNIFSLI